MLSYRTCLVLAALLWSQVVVAQAIHYEGCRLALFDFTVIRVKDLNVEITARVANTGRFDLPSKCRKEALNVEIDTLNLPPVLWGHEESVAEAVQKKVPILKAGAISAPLWFNIAITKPDIIQKMESDCADLRIDTAYFKKLTADEALMHVIVSNAGSGPAIVYNEIEALTVNFYFVGGSKLTRGAILAAVKQVSKGTETVTGVLAPQQRMLIVQAVSLKQRTKFAPNIFIELATPSKQKDCFPGNNTYTVFGEQ